MEERIMQFAKALRAGGAPVSQAETLDAMRAVSRLGIRRHFFSNRRVDIPSRVAGGLNRIHPQLVIATPELFTAPKHLVVDVAARGENDHRKQ